MNDSNNNPVNPSSPDLSNVNNNADDVERRTPKQINADEVIAAEQIRAELDYAVSLSEAKYKVWKDARLLLPWVADFRRKKLADEVSRAAFMAQASTSLNSEESIEDVVERLWQNFLTSMKTK